MTLYINTIPSPGEEDALVRWCRAKYVSPPLPGDWYHPDGWYVCLIRRPSFDSVAVIASSQDSLDYTQPGIATSRTWLLLEDRMIKALLHDPRDIAYLESKRLEGSVPA